MKVRNAMKKYGAKLRNATAPLLGGVAAMVAAPAAFAGGDGLGATMLAKLTGVEGDVKSVLIVLVGVIALFILYAMIKRARP